MGAAASRRFLTSVWLCAVLAAAYALAGKLGLRLAFVNPSATPVWAPSGIALAALLLVGNRVWPGIFVGAFVVNVTTAGSFVTCLGIALGNTLEAMLGAWLVRRFAGGLKAFDTPQGVFKFAGLAVALSTTVSATVGTTSLIATGYAPTVDFGQIWGTWWLGDGMGDLLIAPLVILWAADWKLKWRRSQATEAILMLVTSVVAGLIAFGGLLPAAEGKYPIEFVCLPFVLWAAFRFGTREAISLTAVLAALAIFGTMRGIGPFARGSPNTSLLLLQGYVGVTALMGMAVATSVWERKRIEAQLIESERSLLRHSSDLEHFARAASHDLREPLRTISLFAQLLGERYRGQISREADEFIEHIVGGASRMENLVNGLLDYNLLTGSGDLSREKVPMKEILDTVQKNLEPLLAESAAQIECAELPTVLGNRQQLVSLCQNLIANAIKYRSAASPVIRIGANRNGHEYVFSVQDNGIGIDPQYRDQIFGLFKRLQSNKGGSGIGLAIARRVVELQGGRIWVESEKGRGATFYFTIPIGDHVTNQ